MSSESVFLTGRNALIVTLIAVSLNPFSIFIGYYLSKELSKPSINIELVEAKVEYNKIKLSQEAFNLIRYNPDVFKKIIESQYLQEMKKMFSGTSDVDFNKWIGLFLTDINEGLVAYDFVVDATKHRNTIIAEYDVKLHLLKKNIDTLKEQTLFDSSVIVEVPDFDNNAVIKAGANSPMEALNMMSSRLSKVLSEKDVLEKLISEFEKIKVSYKNERSGEVTFDIGFLNAGDTDGVIYPEGKISVNGAYIKIKQRSYTVIAPHSFSKFTFSLNKSDTPQAALDSFKSIIEKGLPESYEIYIQTTGREISKKAKLPVI